MVGQPIGYSRSQDKAPTVVFTGGSALNLIINISVHGIIVSTVDSQQARVIALNAIDSIAGYISMLSSLYYLKPKTKTVVLGGWL